jgi:hypothetical protein
MIIGRRKTNCAETNYPNAFLSTTRHILTAMELNRGLCAENLVTNRLSCDTAFLLSYSSFDHIFREPLVPVLCRDYRLFVP